MIDLVAMEEPSPRIVRKEIERHAPHVGRYDDRVLHGSSRLEEVPMQMHGVKDHAVVDHVDADAFSFVNQPGLSLGEDVAVDRPGGAHHTARKHRVDFTVRLSGACETNGFRRPKIRQL